MVDLYQTSGYCKYYFGTTVSVSIVSRCSKFISGTFLNIYGCMVQCWLQIYAACCNESVILINMILHLITSRA